MSKPERNSRRLAKGEPEDTPYETLEDLVDATALPEVEASRTPDERTTKANTHASSSISTPEVKPTPTPSAQLRSSSTRITKQDIERMITAAQNQATRQQT